MFCRRYLLDRGRKWQNPLSIIKASRCCSNRKNSGNRRWRMKQQLTFICGVCSSVQVVYREPGDSLERNAYCNYCIVPMTQHYGSTTSWKAYSHSSYVRYVSSGWSGHKSVMSVIPAYIVAIRMKMPMPDIAYLMLLVGIVLGRLISVWLDRWNGATVLCWNSKTPSREVNHRGHDRNSTKEHDKWIIT